jgi:hyperosmotically inducible protein
MGWLYERNEEKQGGSMTNAVRSLIASFLIFGPALYAATYGCTGGVMLAQADQKLQARITREVYHELMMLPQLTIFDHIAFKVDGATITLIGAVRNAILKDAAEKVVKRVEGVERVNNQIEILPPLPSDDRIRLAVAHAIFSDERLFKYSLASVPPIHIIVKNGHVTLEGVVDNETDKNAAYLRANSVPGVFSVENHLQVGQGK